jgi:hypothetical protein
LGRTAFSSLGSPSSLSVYIQPLKKLPQYLCGFFLLLYTLFFVYRAIVALSFPYPLAYWEGAVFYEAAQLSRQEFSPAALYPPNTGPPYLAGIYTPLFYYVTALFMFLTGPTSILSGRLITVLASAYLGYLLYRIARKEEVAPGRRARLGLAPAAALTPFATMALYTWGVLAQGAVLALCLSLSGVFSIWQADTDRRNKRGARPLITAGFLCALALLCQQTALAAPLAILIWLGISRRWRDLGQFAAAFFGLFLVVSLAFQLLSGDNFLRHITGFTSPSLNLGASLRYLVLGHFVLLALALSWVARPLVGRFERMDLWRIYFLTALVLCFTAGNATPDYSFALEILCLMSLMAWWQIGRLISLRTIWRLFSHRPQVAPIAMAFMALQLFLLWHVPVLDDSARTPGPAEFEQGNQVAAQVSALGFRGPLLADNSGWLADSGLTTELDDPQVFGQLAQEGKWNNRPFLDRLNNGYYKSVFYEISQPDTSEAALEQAVSRNTALPVPGRFDPVVLQVLQDRTKFTPLKRIGRWVFLVWKDPR